MRNLAQRMPARLAVLSLFGLLALAGFGLQAAGGFDGVKRASAQTVLPVSVGGPYSGTAGIPITVSGFASGASNPQYS
ncbi:MAG TPA: hypothetical protein VMU90_11930 [Solirubrobacteraceae bacterium]|nr:hypothetical protein [Solirubrobacteraceae bacterium]